MKVLLISDNPRSNTGYAKITAAWAKYLVTQGHEVLIMAGSPAAAQVPFKEVAWEGTRFWLVPDYGNAEHIRWFLDNETPDVVVANADPRFFDYLFKMDNEIRRKCPLVFYHLWDDAPFPDFNLPYYFSCDRIICGSKFTYDLLSQSEELTKITPVDYVPIGIDTDIYKPLDINTNKQFLNAFHAHTGNRFINAGFVVGVVGRNSDRKNLIWIIDTFSKWQKDKDDVILFVHSPAMDSQGVMEYILQQRYPNDNIIYSCNHPAQLRDEVINQYYNFFDILLNRSSAEGFGLPIAEAMAAGTPCISPDTGGPSGLITPENGWLLESDIKALFSNAITPYIYQRFVSDEKIIAALDEAYYKRDILKQKASKCRDYISQNYSVRQMVQGFEASLKKAIDSWQKYSEFTVHAWPRVELKECKETLPKGEKYK